MDYDKLIERLRHFGGELGATPLNNVIGKYMLDAADIISTLQAENEELRNELEQVKAERDAVIDEVKHLKAVMRDEGIVVIPPKYPWEKSEWNV